jgi:hypothetical protein
MSNVKHGRIVGKPHFAPWSDDPDPPDYWEDDDYEEMRVRMRAYWAGTDIGDAVRQWNEEKHERVQGGATGGQFGSGTGPMTARKEKSAKAAAAIAGKHKERAQRERAKTQATEQANASAKAEEEKKVATEEAAKPKTGKSKKPATKGDFEKAKIRYRMDEGGDEKFLQSWNEKIGMDPDEFKRTFTGGLQDRVDMRVVLRGNEFSVTGDIRNEDGDRIGEFTREIKPDKHEAYSAYFKLERAATGDDTGKRILGGNVEAYEAMGITTVKVSANIDVGGYAWAKYGYVPTPSAWSSLSGELEEKLDSIEGGGGSRRGSGDTMEAEEWDMVPSDQQAETQRKWMRDSRDEFLQSEIDNWRENGEALESAKRDIAERFNNADASWAMDAMTELRKARTENEEPDIPYSDDQIMEALTMAEYESRNSDGRDDFEFEWNDDKLQAPSDFDPNQKELPGMEETDRSTHLTQDMRDAITDKLSAAADAKAESDAEDVEPPDYLSEQVEEYQEEYWDQKSDREKLEHAIEYDLANYEIEPDEDDEPEMELSEEEKQSPEIAELYDLVRSSDPKSLWKIADSKLGKKLLLNSGWSGVLNLKDPESYARFKSYVGRVKSKPPEMKAAA